MATPTLSKLNNIVARPIPPEGSSVVGQTEDGRVLYKRTLIYGENVQVVDDEGTVVWERHPTTAQPLYRKRKLVRREREQLFTLYDAGNGQVMVEEYAPPTESEKREAEVTRRAAEIRDQLARGLAERGLGVDDLLNALGGSEDTDTTDTPRRRRRAA